MPSVIPTTAPSSTPSNQPPSSNNSNQPSLSSSSPSAEPSMKNFLQCNSTEVYEKTHYIGFGKRCYKIEVFEGGLISFDNNNRGCSKLFLQTRVISEFDSYESEEDVFHYKKFKDIAYLFSGTVQVKSINDSRSAATLLPKLHFGNKTFEMDVLLPQCTSEAEAKSLMTKCSSLDTYGKTYFLGKGNRCYKIELFDDGIISFDEGNQGCSKHYIPMKVISKFHFNATETNSYHFKKYHNATDNFSGIVHVLSNDRLTNASMIANVDPTTSTFDMDVILPQCMAEVMARGALISNCKSVDTIGKTHYIGFGKRCYKIEVFEGGLISFDNNNRGCSKLFLQTRVISEFDSYESEEDVFHYKKFKDIAYLFSGTVQVKSINDSRSAATLLPKLHFGNKTFEMDVLLPQCTSEAASSL